MIERNWTTFHRALCALIGSNLAVSNNKNAWVGGWKQVFEIVVSSHDNQITVCIGICKSSQSDRESLRKYLGLLQALLDAPLGHEFQLVLDPVNCLPKFQKHYSMQETGEWDLAIELSLLRDQLQAWLSPFVGNALTVSYM